MPEQFDLEGFCDAIQEVTTVYRKGPTVEERDLPGVHVVEVWGYPHTDDADPTETMVDLVFVNVGVKPDAKNRAEEFLTYLRGWDSPTLAKGPSYIHTGGELGSQELALRLFAVMHVLGYGQVMSGADLGFQGDEVREMAGKGLLYVIPTKDLVETLHTG